MADGLSKLSESIPVRYHEYLAKIGEINTRGGVIERIDVKRVMGIYIITVRWPVRNTAEIQQELL